MGDPSDQLMGDPSIQMTYIGDPSIQILIFISRYSYPFKSPAYSSLSLQVSRYSFEYWERQAI